MKLAARSEKSAERPRHPPAMTRAALDDALAAAYTLAARIAHEIARFWEACPKRTCRRRRRCVNWQECRAASFGESGAGAGHDDSAERAYMTGR